MALHNLILTLFYFIVNNITNTRIVIPEVKEENIGTLIIEKINLQEDIYDINSSNNTIEKHVTILKGSSEPNDDNSIIFLAAHSGIGKIAYFDNLDKLKLNDEIILIYKNKTYKYLVSNIEEQTKNGYINISKKSTNQLILTTCSKNKGKQLIIECLKKH